MLTPCCLEMEPPSLLKRYKVYSYIFVLVSIKRQTFSFFFCFSLCCVLPEHTCTNVERLYNVGRGKIEAAKFVI